MAVTNLRSASSIPIERLVGGGGSGRRVAFNDPNPPSLASQAQRRSESRNASADDNCVPIHIGNVTGVVSLALASVEC